MEPLRHSSIFRGSHRPLRDRGRAPIRMSRTSISFSGTIPLPLGTCQILVAIFGFNSRCGEGGGGVKLRESMGAEVTGQRARE